MPGAAQQVIAFIEAREILPRSDIGDEPEPRKGGTAKSTSSVLKNGEGYGADRRSRPGHGILLRHAEEERVCAGEAQFKGAFRRDESRRRHPDGTPSKAASVR